MSMSKNTIYTLIIVVCFIGAGVLAYTFIFSSGGSQISDDEMTWVKCNNPACGAEYEMGKRKYYEDVEEKAQANPMAMTSPPLTCEKCGKNSIYRAIKCENCGNVFIEGISGANDLSDRCPKCKHSAIEDSRKARLAE
jgi:predicted Zn-ribbon and HTH transcriptional regulator